MQVPFTNGNVTIVLQSVKVDDAVKMKLQMTSLDSSNDWLSLLPKGEPFTHAACQAYGCCCRAVASLERELAFPVALIVLLIVSSCFSVSGLQCTHHTVRVLAGETPLLPGTYSLVVVYSGDSVYAAASVATPYAVDALCLLQVLHLAV